MEKRRKPNDANASRLAKALMELGSKIGNSLGRSGERATGVPGLMLYRCTAPTVPSPCTYEPSLLLIAQGKKASGPRQDELRFWPIAISPDVARTAGCEPSDHG